MVSHFSAPATREVQESKELDRILSIPRRIWTESEALDISNQITKALKTPRGTMSLRPIQALALLEIGQWRGALLPIKVGGGKTLTSFLAPRMTGAKRPLLLLPAALRDKTIAEMTVYRKDWVLPHYINVVSYETLSTANNANFLNEYQPDLIVCDEAHKLKNTSAAVTKRVSRYMKEHYGRVPFVAMSGTLTKRSIKDFAHLGSWALQDRNPVPQDFLVLDEWSRALDVNVNAQRKLLPGALGNLRAADKTEPIRKAYQRRLVQTPGVIATQDKPLPIKLTVNSHLLNFASADWAALRDDWVTPDGWECADGIEVWRHARELAVGCYYRWNPRPPTEWMEARSAWGAQCRKILKNNRRQLDSELQVVRAVQAGEYDSWVGALYADWKTIEPTFSPNVEAVWTSTHATDWIKDWADQAPGIVWVSHRFLGSRLEKLHGVPYFGGGGTNKATGRTIESWRPSDGTIVASIAANSTGRNLQAWNRNLIVGVPPNGAQWEQLLGRTHRPGQLAAEVTADVLFGCFEDVRAFWKAVDDARYAQAMTGQAQKLCHIALTDIHDQASVTSLGTAQWQK